MMLFDSLSVLVARARWALGEILLGVEDENVPMRRRKLRIEVVPKVPPGCTIEQDEEEDAWVVYGKDGADLTWANSAAEAAEDAWDIYHAFDHTAPLTTPPDESGSEGGPSAA